MRAVASRWGGDARGTGPPDPAGLRHPRLSVRGRTGRGAAAQEPRAVIGQAVWSSAPHIERIAVRQSRGASARCLGIRITACDSDAPVCRVYTTIPWWHDHPPSVTAARSPGSPGESCFGPLGQALAGQFRRARGRAVYRGADAKHHPARRGLLGWLADRGPSCGTGDPFHAVLRIRSAAGPRRPEPRAPHAPPADLVVTPCRFGDNPHVG